MLGKDVPQVCITSGLSVCTVDTWKIRLGSEDRFLKNCAALAFQFVKYLGAGYLIYLGIKTLRTGRQQLFAAAGGKTRLARIFGQGFLVNLLNPKTALFLWPFCRNSWIRRADTSRSKYCS
jgi:hypothetical protein